ncbi:405_t:CDS:2, partial [Acaulospora colombiana]
QQPQVNQTKKQMCLFDSKENLKCPVVYLMEGINPDMEYSSLESVSSNEDILSELPPLEKILSPVKNLLEKVLDTSPGSLPSA